MIDRERMHGISRPGRWGNRGRAYVWPITKENVRLTIVARLWPADRVSRGCTSDG